MKKLNLLIVYLHILSSNGTDMKYKRINSVDVGSSEPITIILTDIFEFSSGLIAATMHKMGFIAAEECINSLEIPINLITLIIKQIKEDIPPKSFEIATQISKILELIVNEMEDCQQVKGWSSQIGHIFGEYIRSPRDALIQISTNILVNGGSSYASLRRIIMDWGNVGDWREFGEEFGVLCFNIFLDDNWI